METARKKLLPLQILKILRENSCKEKPITQAEIGKLLRADGHICDRKTISRNIGYLLANGHNIEKISGGGSFYVDSTFSEDEIIMIVDAIYSSPKISQANATLLIDKLSSAISYKIKYAYKNVHKVGEVIEFDRQTLLFIEKISQAVNNNNKIYISYNQFDKDEDPLSYKEEFSVVSPYFVISENGKYFLVCCQEDRSNLTTYNLDHITDVEVRENTQAKPITQTNGADFEKYASEHINNFSSRIVNAKIRLCSHEAVENVVECFGKMAKFTTKNNVLFANVTSSESAIVNFALQNGTLAEIVEPSRIRELIKLELCELENKYNRKN